MSIQPRSLGTIADADTQTSVIDVYTFVRIDLGGGVGTKCFTNKICGSSGYISLDLGDNGGVPLNWYEYDVSIGSISESLDSPETINFVKFGNMTAQNGFAAKQFTKWANTPGLRLAPIYIYRAQFNLTTGAILGSYKRFYGQIGGGTLTEEASLTVKEKDTPFTRDSPSHPISPSCVNLYRGVDCGYAAAEPGVEVTCDFSRGACSRRSNLLNFNGFDRLPIPGSELHWTVT